MSLHTIDIQYLIQRKLFATVGWNQRRPVLQANSLPTKQNAATSSKVGRPIVPTPHSHFGKLYLMGREIKGISKIVRRGLKKAVGNSPSRSGEKSSLPPKQGKFWKAKDRRADCALVGRKEGKKRNGLFLPSDVTRPPGFKRPSAYHRYLFEGRKSLRTTLACPATGAAKGRRGYLRK